MIDQNLGTISTSISINQKYILIYIITRDTIRSRQNTRYIGDCDLEITPKWISESQSLWLIIEKKLNKINLKKIKYKSRFEIS